MVLIWVCSWWREREKGVRKEERHKLDRGVFLFFGNIFYCVDVLF